MAIKLDPEVVELCRAINLFAGLRTYSSCCGHGHRPLEVWFRAASVESLFPLLRAIDIRYGGPDGRAVGWEPCPWQVETVCTDLPEHKVTFVLRSRVRGGAAYDEAAVVAANLRDIAADDKLRLQFSIFLRPDDQKVVLPV